MGRKEVENLYDTGANGIICSPGKFEGEPIFAPHFWFESMDGADFQSGAVVGFVVTDEDRAEFPELGNAYAVFCEENEQGFVSCQTIDTESEWDAECFRLEEDYVPED